MIDQSLVRSGFDTEILMGSRYLRYLLLSYVETGTFPLAFSIDEPALDVTIHPPEDYERLYEPHPDAEPLPAPVADGFDTEILFDHGAGADLRVRMRVDLRLRDTGQELSGQFIDLFVTLALETETTEAGLPRNPQLRFEVVDLEVDTLLGLALALGGQTPQDLLPQIKEQVDRQIDLGVAGADQNLQGIEIRKLEPAADHPAALAAYINLRLRSGPEPDAFLGERGDPDDGQNFLPPGDDLAFAIPGTLYGRLGDDARFRMAEETSPGSGRYHFPIREQPGDPESDQLGKIKDITVEPRPGNVLRVDVHGEFFVDLLPRSIDIVPDPDFHFRFDFTPRIEGGLLEFDIEHDLDVDLLGEFLLLLGILALVFSLGTAGFMALVILAVQELVVEPIAQAQVSARAEGSVDASFLDALPTRVAVERRRWDPFFTTRHQIAALVDGIQITGGGIAFSGRAALAREPEPVGHLVIRDEARDDGGEVAELWYRVRDFARFQGDFTAAFPATDRSAFGRVQGDRENDLFTLTLPQVRERIPQSKVRERITYVPKKVYVREGQVRLLMCISETEVGEERGRLIGEFRAAARARILADQGDDLREEVREQLEEELGEPPTDEQVQEALDARLDELVAEEEPTFVEEDLPGQLESAVEARLRFDLDSPELLALEDDHVLFIRGYQRIRMRRNGKVSRYYRDRPDGDPRDNLLSLPRYTPEQR